MKKFVKIFAITAMAVSLLATSFAFADGKAPETREKGTVKVFLKRNFRLKLLLNMFI